MLECLGEGLELVGVNGERFETNEHLFANDTAPVTDSEERLCRLVSVFRECERRKLQVIVDTEYIGFSV